jgi:hypothetical protein
MHSHFTAVAKVFGQFQYPTSPLSVLSEAAHAAAEASAAFILEVARNRLALGGASQA